MSALRPPGFAVVAVADVAMRSYSELPGLEDVNLEDSLVREIVETQNYVSFTLTVVLRPTHPCYGPPIPDERHCFRAGTLTFPHAVARNWTARAASAFVDGAGAVDWGNIDRFVADPRGFYHLEGEWGSVDITSGAPQLDVLATENAEHAQKRQELAAWIEGRALSDAHEHELPHDDGHHHDH